MRHRASGPERPGVIRVRDFRLFWIGETTSQLGSSVTSLALPLLAVLSLHADALQVSLLAAAAWVPWLLIGLPVGAWVDRLPRRRVMVAADMVSMGGFASIPIAAWLGELSIVQLFTVALLGGSARVVFETAYSAYFPSLVTDAQLPAANSLVQGSQSASRVAGPGVAGAMTSLLGAASGVLLDSISFLISALSLLSIRRAEPHQAPPGPVEPLRAQIAEGIRFVVRDPYLRGFALFGGLCNLGLVGYQSLLVLFLVRDVGLGGGVVGLLLAATSAGGVLGAALAGPIRRRLGSARGLLVCLLIGCPLALLIPLTRRGPGVAVFVLASLLLVAAIVAGNVLQASWRPVYTPKAIYARVTVTTQMLNYGTIPLGALVAGALATTLTTRTAIWIMTAVVAVAPATILLTPVRYRRDLPPPTTPGGESLNSPPAPELASAAS